MSYCDWRNASEIDRHYHDTEWGVPVHDDLGQFEHLFLECMQCGLSWELMLKKREIFRACFDGFDFRKIAEYTQADVERIIGTENMIKAPRKVNAIINNAKRFLEIIDEFGSFDSYIWSFTDGKTVIYPSHANGRVPVSNGLSDKVSRDMKKRGFKYVGSINIYSHLQAAGIINDHSPDCPCYGRINASHPTVFKRADKEVF
ncbi:MAG: DNA-3-methyladenine glycosylase I [Ruminococcaceae bacterium]|nr:DNA-3-methyladenine glycosylase I [Oscillospiraceae bacterium]